MSNNKFPIEYIITFMGILIGLILVAVAVGDYRRCAEKDGTFVRGLVWFECVESKR